MKDKLREIRDALLFGLMVALAVIAAGLLAGVFYRVATWAAGL